MNQIKAVVWGAALVLLALIGGTGWLLYERIESTVAPKDAATKGGHRARRAKNEAARSRSQ
jgi:hypothetical protein